MTSPKIPYFKGIPRQRGRGIGALAATVARTSFPIIRKYLGPVAKRVGRSILESALPEIGDVVSGKQNIKKAVRNTASKTFRKQTGGGVKRTRRKTNKSRRSRKTNKSRRKKVIKRQKKPTRSRADIFKNLRK